MVSSYVLAFLLVLPLAMGQLEVNPLEVKKLVAKSAVKVLPVAVKSETLIRRTEVVDVDDNDDDEYDYQMCDGSENDVARDLKAPSPKPVKVQGSESKKLPTLIKDLPKVLVDSVVPKTPVAPEPIIRTPVLVKEASVKATVKVAPVPAPEPAPVKAPEPAPVAVRAPAPVKQASVSVKATVKVAPALVPAPAPAPAPVAVRAPAPAPVAVRAPAPVKQASVSVKATVKVAPAPVAVRAPAPAVAVRAKV